MKILISRPDKIGDVVLALHGAKQLKRLKPHWQVFMHVGEYTLPLVRNVSFLDGFVVMGEDLAPHQFDAVVDLMAKSRTAWMYFTAGIPIRIGNSARWFGFLYNRRRYVRRSKGLINEAEYNWTLLSAADPSLKNTPLKDSLVLDDFVSITEFPQSTKDTFLLMPGVSVSAESWPLHKWFSLAKLITSETTREVIFLLGPAEQSLEPRLRKLISNQQNIQIARFDDLKAVLGYLKSAKGYVGPSTGITHLASLARVPGVGLYPDSRSMHPNRWQPFQSSLRIVSPAANASPGEVAKELELAIHRKEKAGAPLISAFVICKNEEENIRRCLESIKWCDEIVIVDSESTDATVDICREYTDRIIIRPWPGHREQKQFALEQCRGEWILNIDSDEEVSTELKGHIKRILEQPREQRDRIHGYFICRVVYFLNRWWDKGGWFPEYRMRFFQRKFAHWGGVNPHEKAIVFGPTRKLPGYIHHFTFEGISDLVDTLNRYSLNTAKAMYLQGYRSNLSKILLRPMFRFFKFYIIKRGYREGRLGLIVACCEGFYTFLKYSKLWELHWRRVPEGSATLVDVQVHEGPSQEEKRKQAASS